ncbi:MAG: NUDIX hydrolase [Parcubacteria group bacterium]|nr:NUDIX hydrolase [Parcubacteria group bacterium]
MNIELKVGVKILLKNKEGKYLLIRRNLEKYPEIKGEWDIVGGRIEEGTSLFENLKREVKEETNLDLKKKPKLITAQDILRIPGKHIVRLTYTGNIKGEPKLDMDENIDYKWMNLEEIGRLVDLDVYFKEVLDNNLI